MVTCGYLRFLSLIFISNFHFIITVKEIAMVNDFALMGFYVHGKAEYSFW